jgi:protein-disulfide isomerase
MELWRILGTSPRSPDRRRPAIGPPISFNAMTTTFTITYDYLCPFARNANEILLDELDAGADYEVTFAPFSLHQNSLPDGVPPIWEAEPGTTEGSGVLALLWSLAVRDQSPDLFQAFHRAVFAARHDEAANLNDDAVLGRIASGAGVDPDAIRAIVDSGEPMASLEAEHTALVRDHAVFGVPTFIAGGEAVFVRFMERNRPDDLQRVLEMLDWVTINEFKRTRVSR